MEKQFSWEIFLKMPVIGIARNISFKEIVQILPLFHASGLNTIEITMNSAHSEDLIRYAAEAYGDKINVGAGTVCNGKDLEKAVVAGAQFIVMPVVNEEVIKKCGIKKLPVFPGAFTPTEIYKAWIAGADMVKVFPTTIAGPEYIRDIKGPLNKVKLLPTGGVSMDNCIHFLKAGAEGLGMGSQLLDPTYIKERNWEELQQHFTNLVRKIEAYKNN